MKRICKQCGKEFTISQGEIKFYKNRKMALPKRCKECRELNKQKNSNDNGDQTVQAKTPEKDSTTKRVTPREPDRQTVPMQPLYTEADADAVRNSNRQIAIVAGILVVLVIILVIWKFFF